MITRLRDALDRPVVEKDRHIVRNARVQLTASSVAIQEQVAPSLGPLKPYEGTWLDDDIWDRGVHYVYFALDPHLESGVPPKRKLTAVEWNQVVCDESRFNLSSNDDLSCVEPPVVNASILPLLYSDTPLSQLV
ncbi:hypothetical protein TNCV_695041 [Trichonephila clavipes]|nr:hypothetical protein TNCV_695041 [Trichonephila clavipes]